MAACRAAPLLGLNINSRVDCDASLQRSHFGSIFEGLQIHLSGRVLFQFRNNPKQNAVEAFKFAPTGQEGGGGTIFKLTSSFKPEYLVAPFKDALDKIENVTFKTI